MLPLYRPLLPALATLALLAASSAGAATMSVLTTPFTGDYATVSIILTEVGDDLRVDLSVEDGIGDLRGVFFNVSDASILEGLSVTGDFVTGFETGNVINMGQGNNLNGGGSPCPCDFGVALGTPGMGKDDLQSASFLLSHESLAIGLAEFGDQWVGVRLTSVGEGGKGKGGGRDGSSKLSGRFGPAPIPEPSPALMVVLGLAGMATVRSTRRSARRARRFTARDGARVA